MKRYDYGVYTVGDDNFFPGIVASINSLKYYGYTGPIAVINIGFQPWMSEYLSEYDNVEVLDIEPVQRHIRFTDVLSDESPVMKGWAYKAFSIVFYDRFKSWTFIDGDFLPLCNLEQELRPLVDAGQLVCTEDGWNTWDQRHKDAIGVEPGSYPNINAGFVNLTMERHGFIVHEWRNLLTRRKPFDLWYGDQGALNAILDKYGIERSYIDKVLWNQTWLNKKLADEGRCRLMASNGAQDDLHVRYEVTGERFKAWHGTGWHKLWHQIGIDHRRRDKAKRVKFFKESQGKSPKAITELFRHFLLMEDFNERLRIRDFRIELSH